MAEFSWNREQIASIFSIYPIVYSISVIFSGRLTDRYGPRRTIVFGAILLALGIGLCSRANSLWEMRLFFGIVAGLGTGAFYVPSVYCVQRWFVKRRGLAVGIVAGGIGLGTLIFAPLATYLIEAIGWRATFLVFAIGLGVLLLAAAAVIRADPSDKGLKPYGYQAEEDEGGKSARWERGFTTTQALKTSSFWLLYAAFALGFVCLTLGTVHIVPYAEDMGFSRMVGAGALSIFGLVNVIGRIGTGGISDRLGRKQVLLASYALIVVAMLCFLVSKEVWVLYVSAGLLGLSYGGFTVQFAAIIGDYFGVASLGTILAIGTTGYGVGGSIGPRIGGAIFEHTGSYHLAFLICAALGVCAIITTIFLKPPQAAKPG
jgi:Arabinose efflux permease